jgi:hypothetical protein
MFNLIMGYAAPTEMQAARMFEYTDDEVKKFIAPGGIVDTSKLGSLPTLVMPELQDSQSEQFAQVGHVEDLSLVGREWRYRFVRNPSVAPTPTNRIEAAARELRIGDWEFNRTHWAVKQVDLYRVLQVSSVAPQLAPQVFRLPTEVPTDPNLVAVMMPFDAGFASVYAALQGAAAEVGMTCLRADDIWLNHHIMEDIINLIWRAQVVVADLTGKNPNVFYEAGVSHTLGREVIQIAQSMDDIPFDLRSIRSVRYLNNDQGRDDLKREVVGRLRTILQTRR